MCSGGTPPSLAVPPHTNTNDSDGNNNDNNNTTKRLIIYRHQKKVFMIFMPMIIDERRAAKGETICETFLHILNEMNVLQEPRRGGGVQESRSMRRVWRGPHTYAFMH